MKNLKKEMENLYCKKCSNIYENSIYIFNLPCGHPLCYFCIQYNFALHNHITCPTDYIKYFKSEINMPQNQVDKINDEALKKHENLAANENEDNNNCCCNLFNLGKPKSPKEVKRQVKITSLLNIIQD